MLIARLLPSSSRRVVRHAGAVVRLRYVDHPQRTDHSRLPEPALGEPEPPEADRVLQHRDQKQLRFVLFILKIIEQLFFPFGYF